jgi:1-acyl-sn-glycerol-3-phosphate acyltransferase
MVRTSRALLRALLLVVWIPTLMLLYALAWLLPTGGFYRVGHFAQRIVLKILGIELKTHGQLVADRPILYLANHASYIDLLVICATIPVRCVSKAEVRNWPIFGRCARLAKTIFINRTAGKTHANLAKISSALQQGDSIMLFPEGTTSDGNQVLTFKSSLLKVLEDADNLQIDIQPVTIAYTQINGRCLTSNERHLYSWFGDMTLAPHLWQLFKIKRSTVEMKFHPVIQGPATKNRKQLAKTCQHIIANGLEELLTRPNIITREQNAHHQPKISQACRENNLIEQADIYLNNKSS